MERLDWINIENEIDIGFLMKTFGGFHDSCIKEMHFVGNGYVGADFGMGISDTAKLCIIFQRQYDNPSAIEMEFMQLNHLSVGVSDNHFPDIFDAALFFKNDKIYWANDSDWTPDDDSNYPNTVWVMAKSVRWRILNGALGEDLFYYSKFDDDDKSNDIFTAKRAGKPT